LKSTSISLALPSGSFLIRGLLDALGMLHEASPLPSIELETMLASYPFHATVFVLPPLEVIYANDAERDQSFAEAVDAKVVRWYCSCGYVLNDVPRLPVAQRAEHVLRILAESAALTLRHPPPTAPVATSLSKDQGGCSPTCRSLIFRTDLEV
jgi:hypothetical protein